MFKFFKKSAPSTADTALEQNIFDNNTFFEGYKKLRDSDTNSNDLLESLQCESFCLMLRERPSLTSAEVTDTTVPNSSKTVRQG